MTVQQVSFIKKKNSKGIQVFGAVALKLRKLNFIKIVIKIQLFWCNGLNLI